MSLHDEITAFTPGMFWSNEHASGYSRAIADVAELAAKADAEISRLIGENAVLRDLLRDVLSLIRDIECDCLSQVEMDNLHDRIASAINGHDVDMPSDGAIYAAASRRANPEAHADLDKLMAIIADINDHDRECEIPPLGWRCTRGKGHSGPCAAVPSPEDVALVNRGMKRLRKATDGQDG